MSNFRMAWGRIVAGLAAAGIAFALVCFNGADFTMGSELSVVSRSPQAAKLNPATLVYKLPSQIHWSDDPTGAKTAVLAGDPSKPGLYVMLVKWTPHHMSHPHWHPNDRFITVLSGTWWVGTGSRFDPESTVPMPAGTFVKHFGKQVHYDGAKDEQAVLEIVGEGPATATSAEAK